LRRKQLPLSGGLLLTYRGHPVLETPLNSGCFLKSFSENASTTGPASLLAVFVADDGAQLTTFGK
jgi:hypothetical protein